MLVASHCPLLMQMPFYVASKQNIFFHLRQNFFLHSIMPFHPANILSTKYSSIESQKLHEDKYKNFLKTLPINRNSTLTEQKLLGQHRQIYFNQNYLSQRQFDLQSRQDKRKREYERIQKENLKFSQRLINAKAFLNRS